MRLAFALLLIASACRPPGYGKDDNKPDASTEVDSGGADAALDAPAPLTCDATFRLEGQSTAATVWLTGSFISWAGNPGAGAIAFTKGVDGAWTGAFAFEAGTHQYKFIVDGSNWMLDPENQNTADDGMGNTNSVYTCVP